jgi:co-chaperonin GroES (HSP10)
MLMQHDADPRKELLRKVGNLDDFVLFGNKVLIAIYERPDKTKSGIHLPDSVRQEDQYQGKAGLVVKCGPSAFVSDDYCDFHGLKADVGDWVAIFVSDGRKIVVNGVLCRVVEDQHVRLKIPAPDSVW